ncbi:hypothetical protein [Pseudonocardia nigra]|uniref:hypothetical protein n=1 Tax=Pseudonocardia nigra TaxID=1921578 RepID=UPI001C5F9D75|nr:hypothetical protein [Pseudonocardia nigra]
MTSFGDILTVLAAAAGTAVLLIMAAVPLLVDHHRPAERDEHAPVPVPAQRGPVDGLVRRPARAVGPRA